MTWPAELELRGAGGEPVSFERTVLSHGVAELPPNEVASDGSWLETVVRAGGRSWLVRLTPAERPGRARLGSPPPAAPPPLELHADVLAVIRHMLRLDEDLSGFYVLAAADPALAWACAGAGRMLRSATVFEDLVKTICTTNCTWSATQRMVGALVGHLGTPAEGREQRRAFPTPEQMAAANEGFYREVARAGYRGAYLRTLAIEVAEGRLDVEALGDPELPDAEVAERLLALAGVGPYALAHVMMLLGRYRRLILDSWTRPTYRRLSGRQRVTDKGIERAFRRYRQFAGLAFWLSLTESWVASD